jgi:DNA-binding GntR family transcriptional regulator
MLSKNAGPFARTLFTKDTIDRLRTDIITGVLQPGTRIVETQLASDLGVSRGPIRAALQLLEQEGLVESMSNGGTKVVGFSIKNVEDMFDFRLMLESKALEICIANPLTNFHSLLDVIDILSEINNKLPKDQLTAIVSSVDVQFHRSIMFMAENQSMLQAWNTMANVLYTVLSITNSRYPKFYDYYLDHKYLSDLIIQRNPKCLEVLDSHIRTAKSIMVDRLNEVWNK